MRTLFEISHSQCKVTVFSWNEKYLIKLERGPLEQTYKVPHLDVAGEPDIRALLSEDFLARCARRFDEMAQDLDQGLQAALFG